MNFFIGIISGIFGGLVGLGGGVLMVPLMVGIKKLRQHKAHGTSLVALVFTGIVGATVYAVHNTVDLWASVILAISAMWPARCGAQYCSGMPETKLKRDFGILLILVSIFILIKPYLPMLLHPGMSLSKILILIATGVTTGFVSGLMGIGGGPIMIVGMVLLAGFDQHTAQGSSLLAMVPSGAVGAFTHWRLGNVATELLDGLILGIIVGTYIGGSFAHILPEYVLRTLFAATLIWTGIRYVKFPTPSCE